MACNTTAAAATEAQERHCRIVYISILLPALSIPPLVFLHALIRSINGCDYRERKETVKKRYIRLIRKINVVQYFSPLLAGCAVEGIRACLARFVKLHITMSYYGSLYYYLVME